MTYKSASANEHTTKLASERGKRIRISNATNGSKMKAMVDRVTQQARRMGCDSSGFFSLFSGQSAQCGPVNNQIQQMRGNLDQITTNLERLRSGGLGGPD